MAEKVIPMSLSGSNHQIREMLSSIVEFSDDAIISKSLDGVVTSWNAAASRIFGYTPEEMVGQPIMKLIPVDRHPEETIILDHLRKGKRIEHYETQRLAKDGRLLDISLTVSPIKDASGKVIGASKIARDITEQRRLDRLVAETNEKLRMAIELTGVGTWNYTLASNHLEVSEQTRYLLPDTVDYTLSAFFRIVDRRDQMVLLRAIRSLLGDGRARYLDETFRIQTSADQLSWIRIRGTLYLDVWGRPERVYGTVVDITQEREKSAHLEEMVRQRTRELEQVNRKLLDNNQQLERFAYIASHDLRSPLKKVIGLGELLERHTTAENDTARDLIRRMRAASERMNSLVDDLLNYSRVAAHPEDFASVDLNQIVQQVIEEQAEAIQLKNAVFELEPLRPVSGNATLLRQLFDNLISNALKFSGKTSPPLIHISTTADSDPAGRSRQIITVSDNGIGFNPAENEHIFEMFRRLNGRSEYDGSGIGLAIVKRVMELHNGTIEAFGTPGRGASFVLTFDAEPAG